MALCYKDRSFCGSNCINNWCYRYASEQLKKEAAEFGLPVAYIDYSKTCGDYNAG